MSSAGPVLTPFVRFVFEMRRNRFIFRLHISKCEDGCDPMVRCWGNSPTLNHCWPLLVTHGNARAGHGRKYPSLANKTEGACLRNSPTATIDLESSSETH